MRVPFTSTNQNFINQIGSLNQKQIDLQKQLSRGQRITHVSDDPIAAGRALNANSEKSKIQTYARNLTRAEFVGNFTLETLEQLKEVADDVHPTSLLRDLFWVHTKSKRMRLVTITPRRRDQG